MDTMENVMDNATEIVNNTVEAVANNAGGAPNYRPMLGFGAAMMVAGAVIDHFGFPLLKKGLGFVAGGMRKGFNKVKDHGYTEVNLKEEK